MTKKNVDWIGVEREYRAGIRPLRDIGREFGITESAIRQKATKEDWIRDLSAKIKAKANDLLRKQEVRKELRSTESAKYEREVIETQAVKQAAVLIAEREDVKRLSGICKNLELELEIEINDLEKKARILKTLTETRKTLIELMRRNYGINDNSNGEADTPKQDSFADWVKNGLLGNVIGVTH